MPDCTIIPTTIEFYRNNDKKIKSSKEHSFEVHVTGNISATVAYDIEFEQETEDNAVSLTNKSLSSVYFCYLYQCYLRTLLKPTQRSSDFHKAIEGLETLSGKRAINNVETISQEENSELASVKKKKVKFHETEIFVPVNEDESIVKNIFMASGSSSFKLGNKKELSRIWSSNYDYTLYLDQNKKIMKLHFYYSIARSMQTSKYSMPARTAFSTGDSGEDVEKKDYSRSGFNYRIKK